MRRSVEVLLILGCGFLPAIVHAEKAEYALRWKSGGPTTATETVGLLKLQGAQVRTVYEVEYFDLGNPPLAGKAPIARRRSSTDKVELTLKYRADAVPMTFDAQTACPLGKKVTVKQETDISVDEKLAAHPVRSISCERQAKKELDFPEPLRAVSRGCVTTMIRIAVDGFKIEEWQFRSGRVVEVSMPGANTDQDLKRFTKVVRRLPLAKLEIEDRTKADAGSACKLS